MCVLPIWALLQVEKLFSVSSFVVTVDVEVAPKATFFDLQVWATLLTYFVHPVLYVALDVQLAGGVLVEQVPVVVPLPVDHVPL